MTNNERIQANNAELREAIEMAEKLPEAGDGQTIYYTRAGACYAEIEELRQIIDTMLGEEDAEEIITLKQEDVD